eukprot:31997-Eustigmatos_ZCMA.PRE.1
MYARRPSMHWRGALCNGRLAHWRAGIDCGGRADEVLVTDGEGAVVMCTCPRHAHSINHGHGKQTAQVKGS